jgi:hypothetical protein
MLFTEAIIGAVGFVLFLGVLAVLLARKRTSQRT